MLAQLSWLVQLQPIRCSESIYAFHLLLLLEAIFKGIPVLCTGFDGHMINVDRIFDFFFRGYLI